MGSLVLLGVVLVALSTALLPRLDDRFGPSQDGFNGAVWHLGAAAIHEDGLIGSGFGARRDVLFDVYAGHPPALPVAIWALQATTGSRAPWTVRAIPLAATVASTLLLAHAARRRWGRSAGSVAAVTFAGTAMVMSYGTMADTWIVGLPIGVATLALGDRDRLDGWAAAVLGCLAVLVSWQGALLAGVAVVVWGRRGLGPVRGLALGVAAGALVVGTWLAQVGLGALTDRAEGRSAGALSSALDTQSAAATQLLGVAAALGIAGSAVVALERRARSTLAVAWVAPALYLVLFQAGAGGHRYWLYWLLIPASLGAGALTMRISSRLLLGLAVGGWLLNVALPPSDLRDADEGASIAASLEPLAPPLASQPVAFIVDSSSYQPWLVALWGRPVEAVASVSDAPSGAVVISPEGGPRCEEAGQAFVCVAP